VSNNRRRLAIIPRAKYSPKVCPRCGQDFTPRSGATRWCDHCAPDVYRAYVDRATAKKPGYYRAKLNEARRARRRLIQDAWGRVQGPRGTWKNGSWVRSEIAAKEALRREGFHEINRCNDLFATFPFDLLARNGERYGVLVTQRIAMVKTPKRHLQLAAWLGLKVAVVYMRSDLRGYVLKRSTDPGWSELTLDDVEGTKWLVSQ
jgi:ribosomal protein L37AE/L43A